MDDHKALWLVEDWRSASDEAKANPLQYGPWTRKATADAFRALDLPVPDELAPASVFPIDVENLRVDARGHIIKVDPDKPAHYIERSSDNRQGTR